MEGGGWGGEQQERRRRRTPLSCPPSVGVDPTAKDISILVDDRDGDKGADAVLNLTLAKAVNGKGWEEAWEREAAANVS